MTFDDLVARFGELAIARNPVLASKLFPGLPEDEIRKQLQRSGVAGEVDRLVAFYRWRNGTLLDPAAVANGMGFFPALRGYYLLDLEMALAHLGHAKAVSQQRPALAQANHYFPLFWPGDTTWLAVDITSGQRNRVVFADHDARVPFTPIYETLDEFIQAAIKSIETNTTLRLGPASE